MTEKKSLTERIQYSRRKFLAGLVGVGGGGAASLGVASSRSSNGGARFSMAGFSSNLTNQKYREKYVTTDRASFDPSILEENELFWVGDGELGVKTDSGTQQLPIGKSGSPQPQVHANTVEAHSDATVHGPMTVKGDLTVNAATSTQDHNVQGASESLDSTFPGWGSANAVAVPSSGSDREITVSFNIAADTDSSAFIECQREDSSGTMQTVARLEVPAGIITTAITLPASFSVPRGRSYQFTRSGNAGVTETNQTYGFTEIGV